MGNKIIVAPFKEKPTGRGEPNVMFTPWTKAELKALISGFPDPTKDPIGFAKEFEITLKTYDPGFSDLYQLIQLLAPGNKAEEWFRLADWKNPLDDFDKISAEARNKCRKLSDHLCTVLPQVFPKVIDCTKVQQCKIRPNESIPDFFSRFEKTFKQYSGVPPENFENGRSDTLLNSGFIQGLDEELVTLVKRNNVAWASLPTSQLITLADKLSQTILKEEKDMNSKIMSLQLKQLSKQVEESLISQNPKNLRQAQKEKVCFYCGRQGHIKQHCKKRKQALAHREHAAPRTEQEGSQIPE